MWELEKYKTNIALVDETSREITYLQLSDEAKNLYKVINKRCLVFCMCNNSIGSIIGYVSFVNSRVVPVMLNAHLETELLNGLIDKYLPSYIWLPEEDFERYSQYETLYRSSGYVLVETGFDKKYDLFNDLCLLLTTSGSTGSPKFVRQSYNNVKSNAVAIVEYLGIDSSERPITTLPMNYTYGLSIINSHLLMGATILVTDKGLMQKEFWNFFRNSGATSFGGVPYTYEMLDRLRFYRMDLPSLKYMTQAGGKITPELHKKFAEYAHSNNKKFIVMYGQCEATARMGYLPAEKSLEKCGSMGIAIPGGKFTLKSETGEEITEYDVAGELIYEGPNVTLGYAECGEDLRKGDENNGILYTGDVAQVDEDGYYYIVGRLKRFLKIYGNRVNLDEIDRMIKSNFGNISCASAGVDDHLYIFITDESLSKEVKKLIVSKTGLNPAAFEMKVIDCIPQNESGKILYKELKKYY